jgi:hypothetical protein
MIRITNGAAATKERRRKEEREEEEGSGPFGTPVTPFYSV